MSDQKIEECCPPQSRSNPTKPKVAHPVSESTGLKLKGTYEALPGFERVYITGNKEAKTALVSVYDIFGFWDTTQHGQDLITEGASKPLTIFMPDLFRGHPFPKEKDGDKDELQKFFAGTAKLSDRLPELVKFGRYLREERGYTKVFVMGYCWGGKLVLQALANSAPFDAGAIVHPAMIAPEDGTSLSAPLGFYPSADEPKDVVAQIKAAMESKPFGGQCEYKLYDTVHHGWAAARADLKNEENKRQYEDVYQRLPRFFDARV